MPSVGPLCVCLVCVFVWFVCVCVVYVCGLCVCYITNIPQINIYVRAARIRKAKPSAMVVNTAFAISLFMLPLWVAGYSLSTNKTIGDPVSSKFNERK